MDHITVYVDHSEKTEATVKVNEAQIKSEVMADAVVYKNTEGYVKEWNINGETVTLGVARLS